MGWNEPVRFFNQDVLHRFARHRGHRELAHQDGSVPKSLRVSAVPVPSRLHDLLDVQVVGRPAQQRLSTAAVGHQFRRIARTPGSDVGGDRMPRHAPAGVDHLPHTVPAPRAEIELQPAARPQLFQRFDMRIPQIVDVNVVANTGTVGSRIVVAEDGQPRR